MSYDETLIMQVVKFRGLIFVGGAIEQEKITCEQVARHVGLFRMRKNSLNYHSIQTL